MACEDATLTVAFINPSVGLESPYLELRPQTIDFQRNIGQFDFARAQFDEEVADFLQPYLDDASSFLHQPLPVVIFMEGAPIHRMLYLPDGVRFGTHNVHIEFHDVRKYLTRGVVDYSRQNVLLKEAYKHVFEQRVHTEHPMFNGIRFDVPEEAYEELIAYWNDGLLIDTKNQRAQGIIRAAQKEADRPVTGGGTSADIELVEQKNVANIIDGTVAFDFDKITPWEAILRLNELFGVDTWVAPDGYLHVGQRTITGITHIAAPDDNRVWKLPESEFNITEPRDPVIKSVVQGKYVSDPMDSWVENSDEFMAGGRGMDADLLAEGVAIVKDKQIGKEITKKATAATDSLESIASQKLINANRKQWSGSIEINPRKSGIEWTNYLFVRPGDRILTVPRDGDSGCTTNIRESVYDITGVQHNIEGGRWTLRLDVIPLKQSVLGSETIETYIRYFNPNDKTYITEDQYAVQKEASDIIGWIPKTFE